ncbi:hypothetical protein BH24ACT26_BH24ACT26_06820 [soil metagenome]
MTWHVEPKMLEAYADNAIGDAHAYSAEAHLLSCEVCRERLAAFVSPDRLQAMWTEIHDVVVNPHSGVIERLLLRIGVKDHVARLVAATPSLRLSWLAAVALTLSFAIISAHVNARGFLLFLIVAPMLPLAGVAVAYGPGVDPTYEIGLAAPIRSFHLLLIRASAVLTSSSSIALVAALALPQRNWAVVAWLLPSLGLTVTSLALSTVIHPLRAAAAVAVLWLAGSLAALMYSVNSPATPDEVFGGSLQVVVLIVTLASIALLFDRRESFERGAHR